MISKPVKHDGKLFRYDFEHGIVEYVEKADAEMLEENARWEKEHGRPLFDIGKDGYMVLNSACLLRGNWADKEIRDAYLSAWSQTIDDENERLVRDFMRYELPFMVGGNA